MIKFSPTALNLGYDFVLLVHFLGHPVCSLSWWSLVPGILLASLRNFENPRNQSEIATEELS